MVGFHTREGQGEDQRPDLDTSELSGIPPSVHQRIQRLEGIFELRIGFGGREFRPLGCYLPDHRFAILVGAEEKGDKIPTNLLEVTHERRKLVIRDSSKLVPHDFS